MLPERGTLDRILSAGLRAPSAENRHFLRFRIGAEGVELVSTDAATWDALPHRRMLAMISYGAVLENIALRSRASGHALVATRLPDASRPELIAHLAWQPQEDLQVNSLDAAIESRHTNRRFYRRAPLGVAALAALADAAQASADAQLCWLDARPKRRLALRAIRIAETERFRRRRLHDELFGAVRFDVGWRASADEGLPPASLEIEAPMRPPFALMRRWPAMRLANLGGTHLGFGWRGGWAPAASAPHLGMVLANAGDERLADLAAGAAFQRLWLEAQRRGYALQPIAAPTVLLRQKPGDGWVDPTVQAELDRLLVELTPAAAGRPCMLFRIGNAAAPTIVTTRRPLAMYVDD